MKHCFSTTLLCALLASLAPSHAHGSEPAQLHSFDALALSPDGSRFASLEASLTALETQPHATLVIRSSDSGKVLASIDPCPSCTYASPAWAPDGESIAFLAHEPGARSTHVVRYEPAASRTIATLTGPAAALSWAPDGESIALLVTPDAPAPSGFTDPGIVQMGEVDETAPRQRLAIVSATDGSVRYASPPFTHIYEYDWLPDGGNFVVSATDGNGNSNWWTARLSLLNATSGHMRTLASPVTQIRRPRVSRDGKRVAYIGGLMSDFSQPGGDVYVVPTSGKGVSVNLTPGHEGTFRSVAWRGDAIIASVQLPSRLAVLRLDPATGSMRALWSGEASLSAGDGLISLSADGGRAAAVAERFDQAPHVLAGPLDSLAQVTRDNEAWEPLHTTESIEWRSDQYTIQGWVLVPRGAPRTTSRPLIVHVHGGPASIAKPAFIWRGQLAELLRRGYVIFQPNPRGSLGRGTAFTEANVRDFGGGDLRDILAGVSAVEARRPIDARRIGIYGYSYGGFMAMWAITQTQRFSAAAAGAGVANWISYYGQNGIQQ